MAEKILKRETQLAETQLQNVKALLSETGVSNCSQDTVNLLSKQMLTSHNQSMVWVKFNNDKYVCSAVGESLPPKPNYYYLAGKLGSAINLYQMVDRLNLRAELPLYAGLKTKHCELYTPLGGMLELKSLFMPSSHTQLIVYLKNGTELINLNGKHAPGDSLEVQLPQTGIRLQLIKDQTVSHRLTLLLFFGLLSVALLTIKLFILTSPWILKKIWHLRFVHAYRLQQFYLVYQPIYDLKQQRPVGVEVLLRWRQRDGTPRNTADFIGALEQDPLMPRITRWVVTSAFDELQPFVESGQLSWFSVNITARDVEQGKLLSVLESLCRRGYPMQYLSLELTERLPVTQWHLLQQFTRRCRDMGCKFKLDDAGTGYGGSLYLQELEFDYLKIDREFVRRLGTAESKLALIQSYQAIARDMGIAVIAEGVNDTTQAQMLYQLGITSQQGWLYAKALSRGQLQDYLQSTANPVPDVMELTGDAAQHEIHQRLSPA
ncbi:EAL domain-containing protein [Shewanella sp. GXUN23E]|uniref:EAL domain-containing protein n=1 Tax=Shewanella sp. GXUN23E TaxID=3422498 RepID=UPI003D7E38D9